MCCCGTPNVNGTLGYRWESPNDPPSVRPVMPPELAPGDVLLYDEPGRCGGMDSHSHHYRVVKRGGAVYVLVYHGGGQDGVRIWSWWTLEGPLQVLDSNGRYWLLNTLYRVHEEAKRAGRDQERAYWRQAAAEKRITVRKVRGRDAVKVEVEP
jgi:hypothetical protein